MSKLKLLTQLISLFCFISIISVSAMRLSNGKYQDDEGRERLFHGVNVVFKMPPYIPLTNKFDPFLSLSDEDIKYFKEFGFNVIRLGVLWEAVEKSYKQYDQVYLSNLESLVNKLGENGIYTILDSHQDIVSRQFCGEGVPYFYIQRLNYETSCTGNLLKRFLHLIGVCKSISEYNFRTDENGVPLLEDCHGHFIDLHTSPDVVSVYEKFYDNEDGFQDSFIDFWKVVLEKFKGNKNIIGLDIWNEPIPGGFYNHPTRFIPGRADNTQLLSLYRKVEERLRPIDNDYVMLFEPTSVPDFLEVLNWIIPYTFKETPISNTSDKYQNQVFDFHSYCCTLNPKICSGGEPDIKYAKQCREFHFKRFAAIEQTVSKFRINKFLSEFGACLDTDACFTEIKSVTDAADAYLTSWTYWMYKPYNDFTTTCKDNMEGLFYSDGSVQTKKISSLTRTYLQATQGSLQNMNFNTENKLFTAKFHYNSEVESPSIIYYNKRLHYENGYSLDVKGVEKFEISEKEEGYIELLIRDQEDAEVNIILSKK